MPFENPKSFSDRQWKRLGTKEARHAAVIAARAKRRKEKKQKRAQDAAFMAHMAALRGEQEPAPRVQTEEDRKIAEFFEKEEPKPPKPVEFRNIEELMKREQDREEKKWCLICDGFGCVRDHGEAKGGF